MWAGVTGPWPLTGRPWVSVPGRDPGPGAGGPLGQGQGTGPRGRAGPLRYDAALDHARARHVPREGPRVPGGPAERGAESGGGAEKGAGRGEGGGGGCWLCLWFSLHDPIDRRTYLVHGSVLSRSYTGRYA